MTIKELVKNQFSVIVREVHSKERAVSVNLKGEKHCLIITNLHLELGLQ